MENDRKTGVKSIGEMMEQDDKAAGRKLVQVIAAILIGVGLIFTGYLNFLLYGRAFPGGMKVLGLIPALLIEGSLAAFLLGSFVWFAHGLQGQLSKIFGWVMFAIVSLNCIVEFNTLVGGDATKGNTFIDLYAFWGVPVIIPLVVGFWKAVLDSDPSIQIMRAQRKLAQTLQLAKANSIAIALGSETSRQALEIYGQRNAEEINAQLTGTVVMDGTSKRVDKPTTGIKAAAQRVQSSLGFASEQPDELGDIMRVAPAPAKGKGGPKA